MTEPPPPYGRWVWDGQQWRWMPLQRPWRMTLLRWGWIVWCVLWAIVWLFLFWPLVPVSLVLISLIAVRVPGDDKPPTDEHGVKR